MIGERLYPLIHEGQPALAGKITGKIACDTVRTYVASRTFSLRYSSAPIMMDIRSL